MILRIQGYLAHLGQHFCLMSEFFILFFGVSNHLLVICRYVAPEYAENGILSVRTDVYAFGIVLLQLISGRKVFDAKNDIQGQSLRDWVSILFILMLQLNFL